MADLLHETKDQRAHAAGEDAGDGDDLERIRPGRSAFAKGLIVLETLIDAERPLTLSDLVARTGMPKSTVYRFASVLVERGWAKESGTGYGVGYLPLRAAESLERSLDIRREAQPFLTKLRDELDETVHLATLDHEFRVVYLEKLVPSAQAVGLMRSRVGSTAPAYCTAVGKATLAALSSAELDRFFRLVPLSAYTHRTYTTRAEVEADLELVRARGYAICDEEHELGVVCIGAAICDRRGDPIAAISLSGPAARMARHVAENSPSTASMREAALALSALVGGAPRLG